MKNHLFFILVGLMILLSSCSQVNSSSIPKGTGGGKAIESQMRTAGLQEVELAVTPTVVLPSDCEIPLTRENYASLDITEEWERIKQIDALNIEYWETTGQRNLLADLRDSSVFDVALHFAGYPNTDGTAPNRVVLEFSDPSHATVTVLSTGLLDDSIMDREYQIELIEQDPVWKIDWAGTRYRCARTENHDWTTTLCP